MVCVHLLVISPRPASGAGRGDPGDMIEGILDDRPADDGSEPRLLLLGIDVRTAKSIGGNGPFRVPGINSVAVLNRRNVRSDHDTDDCDVATATGRAVHVNGSGCGGDLSSR